MRAYHAADEKRAARRVRIMQRPVAIAGAAAELGLSHSHHSPQSWEAPFVIMCIKLGPVDKRAVRLDDSTNVIGLVQQFAGDMDGGIA
jgi:hypothetical protein